MLFWSYLPLNSYENITLYRLKQKKLMSKRTVEVMQHHPRRARILNQIIHWRIKWKKTPYQMMKIMRILEGVALSWSDGRATKR